MENGITFKQAEEAIENGDELQIFTRHGAVRWRDVGIVCRTYVKSKMDKGYKFRLKTKREYG